MKGGANESEKMVRGVTGYDFSLVLIITPARKLSFLRSISALERRVILSVFSRMNQIRSGHGETRVEDAPAVAGPGVRCPVSGESILVCDGTGGAAHAAARGLPAEMPAPPALRGGLVLKFETRVHQAARCGPAGRIHPSNPAIASRRSVIGAGVRLLLRYIPETKNVVRGAAGRRGGRLPRASCGGISRGTLLAILDASTGG